MAFLSLGETYVLHAYIYIYTLVDYPTNARLMCFFRFLTKLSLSFMFLTKLFFLCFWRNFCFYVFDETFSHFFTFLTKLFFFYKLHWRTLFCETLFSETSFGVDWLRKSFPWIRQVLHWLRQWHFGRKPKMTSQTNMHANNGEI